MIPAGPDPHLSISLSAVTDFGELADRWTALEARSNGSFFQSWAWVGCLAEQRFDDPVLLEARSAGRPVALALFNRCRGGWLSPAILHLGESGQPAFDAVFVEYNGPLIERGREAVLESCLRTALQEPLQPGRNRSLVLSGVDDACLTAARRSGGVVAVAVTRPAPKIAFEDLGEAAFLASLSANTRYQIRRSGRQYGALGPVALRRAGSVAEAHDFLDRLAVLHQRTWRARGREGAFARPEFRRFHQALIARAMPAGGADLLRISAGERVIGYLYNFRWRGTVSAYQSGFDYDVTSPQQKPGLTCHHLAIEMYRAEGAVVYDFLAGEDRYKRTLANAAAPLHWIEVAPARSLRGIGFRLRSGVTLAERFFGSFFRKEQPSCATAMPARGRSGHKVRIAAARRQN